MYATHNRFENFDKIGIFNYVNLKLDLKKWDTLNQILTDLFFIETCCFFNDEARIKLISSYSKVLKLHPEGGMSEKIVHDQQSQIITYIDQLLSFASRKSYSISFKPTSTTGN